jgi:hypothetical protein
VDHFYRIELRASLYYSLQYQRLPLGSSRHFVCWLETGCLYSPTAKPRMTPLSTVVMLYDPNTSTREKGKAVPYCKGTHNICHNNWALPTAKLQKTLTQAP